jgi:hypothetical protein
LNKLENSNKGNSMNGQQREEFQDVEEDLLGEADRDLEVDVAGKEEDVVAVVEGAGREVDVGMGEDGEEGEFWIALHGTNQDVTRSFDLSRCNIIW